MSASPMPQTQNDWRQGDHLKLHRIYNFGEVSNSVAQSKSLINKPIRGGDGLKPLKYLILGVAPHLAGRRSARGGARNSASRVSHALTAAQVSNLIDAAAHAAIIGLPLTRMITIHWKASGVTLEAMARATGRYIDLMSKTLARHGSSTAWLWVHENGDGKGWHCHILAHVPRNLTGNIASLQKRWLRSITGKPYRSGVILSRPVGGRLGIEISNPELHAVNLDVAVSYVLKGADKAASQAHDLSRLEPGGEIIGRRCSTSQNISIKARKAI